MRSALVIAITAFALIGCGGSGDSGKNSGSDSPNGNNKVTDTTDRSMCRGSTPSGLTIMSYAWESRARHEAGIEMQRLISFQNSTVTIQLFAQTRLAAKQVSVTVPVRVQPLQFDLLGKGHDEAELPMDNGKFTLYLDVQPASVQYTFEGPCLKLTMGTDTMTMVPRRL